MLCGLWRRAGEVPAEKRKAQAFRLLSIPLLLFDHDFQQTRKHKYTILCCYGKWRTTFSRCESLNKFCSACLRIKRFVKMFLQMYLSKSGSTFAFFFWLILLVEPPPFFIGIWKASTRTNSPLLCNTVTHIPHSSHKEQKKPYCQNNSFPDKLASLEILASFHNVHFLL